MPALASGTDVVAAAEAARRKADPLTVYDLAASALAAGRDEPRLKYLQVLALAQLGDTGRAERLYRQHGLDKLDDEDALALKGRLAKERALAASGEERLAHFRAASEAYLAAFALRSGYFPGINAATTAWAAGNHNTARELALAVLDNPDVIRPASFYAAASRAEALLLLGRTAEAGEAVGAALAQGDAGAGDRASAYRQFAWLHESEGVGDEGMAALLARLRPPPVLTFCGHMFRADEAAENALASRIATEIDRLGATIAYGALACGADILIAEEILRRGGELNVVLPFALDDFVRASVLPGGREWMERFETCLAGAASILLATRTAYVGHDEQFSYGSMLSMGLARLRAGQLSTDAVQLAIWDGEEAAGGAGTAVDVAAWRAQGGAARTIPLPDVDRDLRRARPEAAYSGPARAMRSIIFTDFAGFSRLSESALPEFWREVMGRIGRVLDRQGAAVCGRNTWGDALFAVIDDIATAAEIALDIRDSMREAVFTDRDLQAGEGMRIGIHFGPIYQDVDPVTSAPTFYGSEVTLTARVEPKVPTGKIYVTQPFAAMLASAAPDRFASRYVGRIELAKNYGQLPMYQLERASRASGS